MATASQQPGSPLTAALVEFHKNVRTIHETSRAQYGSYADLSTVLGEILPKLADAGIRLSQSFRPWGEDGNGMILITSIKHVSGEEERSEVPLLSARSSKGNPLHDWGGAVTYQRRYAILAILGLAAGITDDDGDGFDGAAATSASRQPKASQRPTANGNGTKAASTAPQPAPQPTTPAIAVEDIEAVKRGVLALQPDDRSRLVAGFRNQFGTPTNQGIADYIKSPEHVEWLRLNLSQLTVNGAN